MTKEDKWVCRRFLGFVADVRKWKSCEGSCIYADGVCDYLHSFHELNCSLCQSAELRHMQKGEAKP